MAAHRGSILVIDDEMGMREGCRRALKPLGHALEVAASGAEGLRKIQSNGFDVVLLDIMMPDMSGLDLLDPIRLHDPDLVCIIITGYATVELAVQAVKRGAYDFISKPFSADDLIRAVDRGLEHRSMSLEARRLQAFEREAQELSRTKEDLERLDRVKSAFMLTVAHELRAPVAAIQGYLKLILEGYASPEKSREMLQRAEARAGELIALIEDLLQLSRIRDAAPTEVWQRVPVADVLSDVASLLKVEADRKSIRLDVQVAAEPQVMAMREHVRQVWTNLISNAIRYTPEGGHVTVTLAVNDGRVKGSVSDTGIGIAPEDLPMVFQEFFRTKEAKAMVKGGTGLGLPIVKRIVDTYGGKISVQSQPGAGSTFTFEFPEAAPEGALAVASGDSPNA